MECLLQTSVRSSSASPFYDIAIWTIGWLLASDQAKSRIVGDGFNFLKARPLTCIFTCHLLALSLLAFPDVG